MLLPFTVAGKKVLITVAKIMVSVGVCLTTVGPIVDEMIRKKSMNYKEVNIMSIYKPGRPKKYNPLTGAGSKPPVSPGEYRIRDSQGNIKYIGETNNLARRTREQERSMKLPKDGSTIEYKVADGRSTSNTRRIHERRKIKKHSPYANKSRGGEGRPAGR